MRTLTITLLLVITIIFAACASQPQAQEGESTTIKKTFQYPNGARIEATYKIYGELPCDGARRLGVPCQRQDGAPEPEGTPRKLTPEEQGESLKRKEGNDIQGLGIPRA